MHPRSAFRSALVALPVAALLGCGGDGPTALSNQLSAELAYDAFDALASISGYASPVAFSRTALRADGIDGAGVPMPNLIIPLDETEPCPVSGTVRVLGSIDINEVTGAMSIDVRETFQNCVSTSSSNRQWTFNGNPDVRNVFSFSGETEEAFAGTGTISGGFRYTSQGQSGTCTMSVTMSFTATSGSVTGTVCGQAVSEQFDLTP